MSAVNVGRLTVVLMFVSGTMYVQGVRQLVVGVINGGASVLRRLRNYLLRRVGSCR